MRIVSVPAVFACLLLLGFVQCDKEDAKSPPEAAPAASTVPVAPSASATAAPPASASASAAAQVPPPKCPSGLTGNAVPAFCIKLPANYAVKDARTSPTKGSIAYDTGSPTDSLMVSYDEESIALQTKDVEGEMKFGGDKIEKKGNLSGGNKWFRGSHQDYARIVTLIKGTGTLTLKCSFTYKPKAAPVKDAIDTCKSITLPVGP
jgi:hypothetical protein